MSMEKYYTPTEWENYPSEDTAINAMRLNHAEDGINELDDRIVELSTDKSEVDWNQILLSGEKIAEITINGIKKDVYTSNDSAKAEAQAYKAEGYATGEQNGIPVESGSPYYQNNAKYFKEQADADATTATEKASEASTSASSASSNALISEGYAVGKQNGSDVASGSPYYHNNAKYFSSQASSSASTATTKAGEASASATSANTDALKAEGYSVGKQNGEDVGSGSPYYHNNAKYYEEKARSFTPEGYQELVDDVEALEENKVDKDASDETVSASGHFETVNGGKLESCIVAFNPVQSGSGDPSPDNVRPITGHTAVEVWEHGKNKLQTKAVSTTYYGVSYTVEDDGSFIASRVSSSSNISFLAITNSSNSLSENQTTPFKSGMTIYATSGISGKVLRCRYTDGEYADLPYNTALTLAKDIAVVYVEFRGTESPSNFHFYPMIRVDGDNTWQPYNPSSQDITVNLGGTRYGGKHDVVSGVLTVDRGYVDLGSIEWTRGNTGTTGAYRFTSITLPNVKPTSSNSDVPNAICSEYITVSPSNTYNCIDGVTITTGGGINLYVDAYKTETEENFKTAMNGVQLVYEFANPVIVQLTPNQINTLIGENNIDVPLEGQTLDSAVYREVFAWDDVDDVVNLRVPISAIGTDESNNDTASKSYSQGDYFYKNGIAKAKTNIASGATFTLGTNYEIKTLAEILKALES